MSRAKSLVEVRRLSPLIAIQKTLIHSPPTDTGVGMVLSLVGIALCVQSKS